MKLLGTLFLVILFVLGVQSIVNNECGVDANGNALLAFENCSISIKNRANEEVVYGTIGSKKCCHSANYDFFNYKFIDHPDSSFNSIFLGARIHGDYIAEAIYSGRSFKLDLNSFKLSKDSETIMSVQCSAKSVIENRDYPLHPAESVKQPKQDEIKEQQNQLHVEEQQQEEKVINQKDQHQEENIKEEKQEKTNNQNQEQQQTQQQNDQNEQKQEQKQHEEQHVEQVQHEQQQQQQQQTEQKTDKKNHKHKEEKHKQKNVENGAILDISARIDLL